MRVGLAGLPLIAGEPGRQRFSLKLPMEENDDKNGKKNGVWLKLSLLILLITLAAFLYKTGFVTLFFNKERIVHFLESLGPLSFIGFILLQAAQVVLAPIPGEVTGIIGGYTYGPVLGVVLSTIGLITGSFIAFSLSRALGRPFVDKFIDKKLMDRFDYLLHHKGLFLIFMLFLIPGFPKDYLCFILGLGHLTKSEFLVVSSVGRLFGTILLTLSGGYIRCHQYGRLSILAGIAIIIVFLALLLRDKIEGLLRTLHLKHYKKPIHRKGHPSGVRNNH